MKKYIFIALFLFAIMVVPVARAATVDDSIALQAQYQSALIQLISLLQAQVVELMAQLKAVQENQTALQTQVQTQSTQIQQVVQNTTPAPTPVFGAIDVPPKPVESLQFSTGWLPDNKSKDCWLAPFNDNYGKFQSYWLNCEWTLGYSVDGKSDATKINISIASTSIFTTMGKSIANDQEGKAKVMFHVATPQLICQSDNNCPITFTAGAQTLTSSMDFVQ